MGVLESYEHTESGFKPLLITNNWQVAQINHAHDQDIMNINSIDIHFETDEVFVLLKGSAILITAQKEGDDFCFDTEILKPNIIYNVPKMCWHNIALNTNAKVLIVEDKDSHLGKYEIVELNNDQKLRLKNQLQETVKSTSWN